MTERGRPYPFLAVQRWVFDCDCRSVRQTVAVGFEAAESAERVAESLRRGDRVVVIGCVVTYSYDKDGDTRYVTEIVASEVCPSLRWAAAAVNRRRGCAGSRPARQRLQRLRPALEVRWPPGKRCRTWWATWIAGVTMAAGCWPTSCEQAAGLR